jgi:hypothetical protein
LALLAGGVLIARGRIDTVHKREREPVRDHDDVAIVRVSRPEMPMATDTAPVKIKQAIPATARTFARKL